MKRYSLRTEFRATALLFVQGRINLDEGVRRLKTVANIRKKDFLKACERALGEFKDGTLTLTEAEEKALPCH